MAVDGGRWEIYVGGAAGAHIRKGDLLTTVDTPEEVVTLTGRFIQYYRETANWLERTYAWVPRLGIEHVRAVVVDDAEGIAADARRRRAGLRRRLPGPVEGARRPGRARPVPHRAAPDRPAAGPGPMSARRAGASAARAGAAVGDPGRRGPRVRRGGPPGRRVPAPRRHASRALDAVCPHRGGPLADGQTDADVVVCPLHAHVFDLGTGACRSGQERRGVLRGARRGGPGRRGLRDRARRGAPTGPAEYVGPMTGDDAWAGLEARVQSWIEDDPDPQTADELRGLLDLARAAAADDRAGARARPDAAPGARRPDRRARRAGRPVLRASCSSAPRGCADGWAAARTG